MAVKDRWLHKRDMLQLIHTWEEIEKIVTDFRRLVQNVAVKSRFHCLFTHTRYVSVNPALSFFSHTLGLRIFSHTFMIIVDVKTYCLHPEHE